MAEIVPFFDMTIVGIIKQSRAFARSEVWPDEPIIFVINRTKIFYWLSYGNYN